MTQRLSFLKTGLASVAIAAASLTVSTAAQAQDTMLGAIKAFPYNFCPRDWTEADGKLLPIAQNPALFSLYGTMYGGDGRSTFAVPDMRGRISLHNGQGPGLRRYVQGERGGMPSITLNSLNLPPHSHGVASVQAEGDRGRPNSDFLAGGTELPYHDGPANTLMSSGVIGTTGGNQGFDNTPPVQAIRWCVATFGIYPSRS